MAGFIIIKAAMRSAVEELERKEKEEKEIREMTKKGFHREMKLMNPATCYQHIYHSKKFFTLNKTHVEYSSEKKPKEIEGYKFKWTNSNHNYEYEWIKNEEPKKEDNPEEKKTFDEWLKKTKNK